MALVKKSKIAADAAKQNAPAAKAACINVFMNSLPFCLGPD